MINVKANIIQSSDRHSLIIQNRLLISVSEIWTAFQLDADAFESKYGFAKPDLNEPVVVHCLSGKRATMASDKLTLLNYENVDIYKGSFNEWKARGGEVVVVADGH